MTTFAFGIWREEKWYEHKQTGTRDQGAALLVRAGKTQKEKEKKKTIEAENDKSMKL